MSRRAEFKVIPPRPKPEPAAKRQRKPKLPTFAVTHRTLGEGTLTGLRLGESGVWLAGVRFGGGEPRTLQVRPEHWATAISDILAVASQVPRAKPVKASATEDIDEEGETESEELTADERAAVEDAENSDADMEAA